MNRQWRLASRPTGMVGKDNFNLTEEPLATVGEGHILVKNLYLSMDPTQRGWMAMDTYLPAVKIGEVMRSIAVGRVEESRHPDYAVGDPVHGLFGWQEYALVDARVPGAASKIPPGVPLSSTLSALGHTGLTAYFGLLDVGRPNPGETVVVSGAAGATGSIVGQIAKIKGCRAIGIAGGKEKCESLVADLGFDGAIDYKSEKVSERLRALCPKGIDIFFDNVGGEILDAALAGLAMRGRVVLCGAISSYNNPDMTPVGPKNYMNLLIRRGRMEGFIISDYVRRFGEALPQMAEWVMTGKIKDRVDIQEGFENAPDTLKRLFTGENAGKQLLKIAD